MSAEGNAARRLSFVIETDEVDGSVNVDLHDYESEEAVGGMHVDHDGTDLVIHVTRLDEEAVGSVKVVVH